MSPIALEAAPTPQATMTSCRQLLATTSAQATGTTIIALTMSAPTVREAIETTRAQNRMKSALTAPVHTP